MKFRYYFHKSPALINLMRVAILVVIIGGGVLFAHAQSLNHAKLAKAAAAATAAQAAQATPKSVTAPPANSPASMPPTMAQPVKSTVITPPAPANTPCTEKALLAEPLYTKSVSDANRLTDSYVKQSLQLSGGNYTPDTIVAINGYYQNGNSLMNSAWQNYLQEIQGCPVDMTAPVLYTPIPQQ